MILPADLPAQPFAASRASFKLIQHREVAFAGNRLLKIYGRFTCASGKRLHRANRIFFASVAEAIAEGYRPCAHCMRAEYLEWKDR